MTDTDIVVPAPHEIVRTEKNPYGRTTDFPYGFRADGTPRKAPIRLLSAFESLLYWLILCPFIWMVAWQLRSFGMDGGVLFDRMVVAALVGWIPFGILGNVVIRGLNKFVLRTDSRRPSKVRSKFSGGKPQPF